MRTLLDTERVPGLLALGALVGILLVPVLWLARLGVGALRARASQAHAPQSAVLATPAPTADAVREPSPAPAEAASPVELPSLRIPLRGVRRTSIPATFHEPRGARRHQGLDIRAARGTPILAA